MGATREATRALVTVEDRPAQRGRDGAGSAADVEGLAGAASVGEAQPAVAGQALQHDGGEIGAVVELGPAGLVLGQGFEVGVDHRLGAGRGVLIGFEIHPGHMFERVETASRVRARRAGRSASAPPAWRQ